MAEYPSRGIDETELTGEILSSIKDYHAIVPLTELYGDFLGTMDHTGSNDTLVRITSENFGCLCRKVLELERLRGRVLSSYDIAEKYFPDSAFVNDPRISRFIQETQDAPETKEFTSLLEQIMTNLQLLKKL